MPKFWATSPRNNEFCNSYLLLAAKIARTPHTGSLVSPTRNVTSQSSGIEAKNLRSSAKPDLFSNNVRSYSSAEFWFFVFIPSGIVRPRRWTPRTSSGANDGFSRGAERDRYCGHGFDVQTKTTHNRVRNVLSKNEDGTNCRELGDTGRCQVWAL